MEIKACKCGGTPEVVKIFPKNRQDCFIRCPDCGGETSCYTSRQNAVKAWNDWRLFCDPIKDMEGVILRIFGEDYSEGFEPTADRTAEELFVAGYRKQNEWISVGERLPENDGKYLVCTQGRKVFIARFYDGVFCCFSDESRVVTHWMELPEPPKM